MKSFIILSGGLLLCSLASAQSYTGFPPLSKGEALQLSQDMSPQARSQLARREAYAAYNEAAAACKSMSKAERKDCTAESKKNLRKDLNYAKEIRTSGTSVGGSGAGNNSGSSSDRVSGSNDLSSAGGGGGGGGRSADSTGGMTGADAIGNDRPGSPYAGQARGQSMTGMSNEKLTAAEKKQFVQTFTPQAQYKLATRESHAAYSEALKTCQGMSKAERTSCMKEARANLKNDMAYAKSQYQQDISGSSGASGNGEKSGMPGSRW